MGADLIIELIALKLLSTLNILLTLCLFLSLFVVLTRLQRDNELTAIACAGTSRSMLLKAVVQLATVFALVAAALTMWLSPWAEQRVFDLKARAKQQSDMVGIASGRFKELSGGRRVLYVADRDEEGRRMREVFLQVREPSSAEVMKSSEAFVESNPDTGHRFAVFVDGHHYVGEPGSRDYVITEYARYGVRIAGIGTARTNTALSTVPTLKLLREPSPRHNAELQWRISLVLAVFILAALALALTRVAPTLGRYLGILAALLVYFLYNNLMGVARSLVKYEQLPALPGMWWVHLVFIALAGGVLFWPEIRKRMRRVTTQYLLPG